MPPTGAGVDVVVAVGGGSAIGLAKAIALHRPVRIVAVPTTYAGSEATNVWGLTGPAGKRTGSADRVLPATVVYDPDLVASLPPELAAASGLNAVAHCVDSLWAPARRPDQRRPGRGGPARAQRRPALRQPPPAASSLYGCYLAAVAFASAGSGLHHKICHVLGGRFDLPHAATHAIVLPYVVAFNAPAAPDAAARIAAALGSIDALAGLQRPPRGPGRTAGAAATSACASEDLPEAVDRVLPAVPPPTRARRRRRADPAAARPRWAGDAPGTALAPTEEREPTSRPGRRPSRHEREQQLTERVVASFAGTPDDRGCEADAGARPGTCTPSSARSG